MKKYLMWPAAALAMTLGLGGCKDALTIAPQQSILLDESLNSPQKVAAGVTGVYAALDGSSLYGTDMILVPELLAGNNYINFNGTFQNYRDLRNHVQFSNNSNAEGIWSAAYSAINAANLVLANLSVVTDKSNRDQYEGEVRFMRALIYFDMVRLYGQQYNAGGGNSQPGVPLLLTGNTTVDQAINNSKLPRATVEQVYAQVIQDLQAAIAKLPAQNFGRASKYSAEGLLARVYLQQGDYSNAGAMADDVISNSRANLLGTLAAVFQNKNNSEDLFEVQQNDQNNAGTSNSGLATFFAGYSPTGDQGVIYGRADISISTAFVSRYDDNDVRGTDDSVATKTQRLIYVGDGSSRTGLYRTLKWRTYGQNIPLIRLAEMYLIRAEVEVRNGDIASATDDINIVRTRSQADPLSDVTLDDVLNERELELAFEGFRLYDYKRTGRAISAAFPATSPKLILPIPLREINLNPNLTQNPGY